MADPISEMTVVPISAAVAGTLNDGVRPDDEAPSAREQDPKGDGPATARPKGSVEPVPTAPTQADALLQDGQQPIRLKDIKVGIKDGRGFQ
jgi:hypothetical protein